MCACACVCDGSDVLDTLSPALPSPLPQMFYDPMIAKLIVLGEDRAEALLKMRQALNNFHVCALIPLSLSLFLSLLSVPPFF